MNPGILKKRIIIQTLTNGKDEEGLSTESWSDFASVKASAEPLKGREYFQAATVNAENTVKFIIRYRSGIKPSMRINYNNRIFNIKSVIDIDEAHREMHLMGEEITDGE